MAGKVYGFETRKKDDPEVCWAKNCRNRTALLYLGWPLCDRHWQMHCAAQAAEEERHRVLARSEIIPLAVKGDD